MDLACGYGRHSRYFAGRGHPVMAIDRDGESLAELTGVEGVEVVRSDLEVDNAWPLGDRKFDGIVVTNYLHRPLLPSIVDALSPEGVLIYQTFAVGNEKFGSPRNPAFLLKPGELLDAVAGRCHVVAYECGIISNPVEAVIQRVCAVSSSSQTVDRLPYPLSP